MDQVQITSIQKMGLQMCALNEQMITYLTEHNCFSLINN